MRRQIIDVTNGEHEYTFPVTTTESAGKDISASAYTLSLGTDRLHGTWRTPDVITRPTLNTVVASLLVETPQAAGTYWLWRKLVDGAETLVERLPLQVVVV